MYIFRLLIQIEPECHSPDEYSGSCVKLDECENLSELRSKNHRSHLDHLYVTLSQCGFNDGQPLVCCTKSPYPAKSLSVSAVSKKVPLNHTSEDNASIKKIAKQCDSENGQQCREPVINIGRHSPQYVQSRFSDRLNDYRPTK